MSQALTSVWLTFSGAIDPVASNCVFATYSKLFSQGMTEANILVQSGGVIIGEG